MSLTYARREFLARLFDDATTVLAVERARPRCPRDITARMIRAARRECPAKDYSSRALQRLKVCEAIRDAQLLAHMTR